MFETLLRLYKSGKLSNEQLENAVYKNWITEEQRDIIINSKNGGN